MQRRIGVRRGKASLPRRRGLGDTDWCLILALANAVVASMNAYDYVMVHQPKDALAAVAWAMSAAYWILRGGARV